MHHPLHWLFEEDKANIENLLFKHSPIILHGHIHMADFQAVNSIRGEHVTIPAGAIYTDRRVSNCYNITTIDIDKEVIKILPRQYSDRRNKFFKDIDTLGNDDIDEFEVKLSDKMLISLKKAKRTYNRDSQMIKE